MEEIAKEAEKDTIGIKKEILKVGMAEALRGIRMKNILIEANRVKLLLEKALLRRSLNHLCIIKYLRKILYIFFLFFVENI